MGWKYDGPGERDSGAAHIDGLYRYAVLLTSDQAKAEALVEQTYLHVIGVKQGPPEMCTMQCWLYRVLRSILVDNPAKPGFFAQTAMEDDDGIVSDPVNRLCELDLSRVAPEQVRVAFQKLPLIFREVILLREFERLPYDQIALVLGCQAATVMSRLTRARGILQSGLCGMFTEQTPA